MRNLFRFVIIAMTALIGLSLTACDSPTDSRPSQQGQIPANLVGTWEGGGGTLVINANGEFTWPLFSTADGAAITFSVSGNNFTLMSAGAVLDGGTFSQVGNTLTLSFSWYQFEFVRQITWTATAVGNPTATINLIFSSDPGALSAEDITISPEDGGWATVEGMTGSGTTRTLAISVVSAGTIRISIFRSGFAGYQIVALIVPAITWTATPVGYPVTASISLDFTANPGSLLPEHIRITSVTGSAFVGSFPLPSLWPNVEFPVTNVGGGEVLVSINRDGVDNTPQSVTLVGPTFINWTARQDGGFIMFEFDSDPGALAATDFFIAAGTGSATLGALSGTGTTRALAISDVNAGNVNIQIFRDGIVFGPRTVSLVVPGDITWTASAYGSPGTTAINFTFSADPIGLLATNITITNRGGSATRGVLSGTGLTRTLTLTGVNAGDIDVSINRAGIASGPQTVTLIVPAITWTARTFGSPTTTHIIFDFNAPVATLLASDITITPGTGSATRGALFGSGNWREIAISNVSDGTVNVSINRAGIASGPQTVTLVVGAALPQLTGSVSITGTPQVGQTLSVNTVNLGGSGTISFQWRRGAANIAGATGSTLTLATADQGANISVVVTRANNSGSVTSPAVGPVTAQAAPAPIAWTATAALGNPTPSITIGFVGTPPAGLVASDITITSGTGSATRGALTGTGITRTLAISNVTGGTVHVSISRAGIASGSVTVTLLGPAQQGPFTLQEAHAAFLLAGGSAYASVFPISHFTWNASTNILSFTSSPPGAGATGLRGFEATTGSPPSTMLFFIEMEVVFNANRQITTVRHRYVIIHAFGITGLNPSNPTSANPHRTGWFTNPTVGDSIIVPGLVLTRNIGQTTPLPFISGTWRRTN